MAIGTHQDKFLLIESGNDRAYFVQNEEFKSRVVDTDFSLNILYIFWGVEVKNLFIPRPGQIPPSILFKVVLLSIFTSNLLVLSLV